MTPASFYQAALKQSHTLGGQRQGGTPQLGSKELRQVVFDA